MTADHRRLKNNSRMRSFCLAARGSSVNKCLRFPTRTVNSVPTTKYRNVIKPTKTINSLIAIDRYAVQYLSAAQKAIPAKQHTNAYSCSAVAETFAFVPRTKTKSPYGKFQRKDLHVLNMNVLGVFKLPCSAVSLTPEQEKVRYCSN